MPQPGDGCRILDDGKYILHIDCEDSARGSVEEVSTRTIRGRIDLTKLGATSTCIHCLEMITTVVAPAGFDTMKLRWADHHPSQPLTCYKSANFDHHPSPEEEVLLV